MREQESPQSLLDHAVAESPAFFNKLIELLYENNVRCDQGIEGLAEDIQHLFDNRWIDAQKNPPPMTDTQYCASESVLILLRNHTQAVAFYVYDDEGNYWDSEDMKSMYEIEDVAYWQPLPASPKNFIRRRKKES